MRPGRPIDHIFDARASHRHRRLPRLRFCDGYAGATILGDGKAALILDIAGIAQVMNLAYEEDLIQESEEFLLNAKLKNSDNDYLVLEHNKNEQLALRLAYVSRIERIPTKLV